MDWCCFFMRKNDDGYDDIPGIRNIKIFSYNDLRKATADFNIINKIGEGGFGSVYKGELKDGTAIAVKVLSPESRQGVREFLTELCVISDIVHENLVTLYGCCIEGAHRILVYNYLENNSLAQTLLGSRQSSIQFDWRTRVRICLGVARGLDFLHEGVQPPIIHRDIKASNVLLDKDLTAKISDFGLAKLLPANATHVSTRVAGTLGYLAPEYALRGQVNKKSDIYSFGVLLLEIVSGRNNTNTRLPYEDQYLLEKTWSLYESSNLEAIIDASLDDVDVEQACRFLKVALLCTQDAMKARPSMTSVLAMLEGRKTVNRKIMKPAVISDFMDLKVRSRQNHDETTTGISSHVLSTDCSSDPSTTNPSTTFP